MGRIVQPVAQWLKQFGIDANFAMGGYKLTGLGAGSANGDSVRWQDVVKNTLLTTRGDIVRRGATAPERVALGASGFYLKSDGTDAVWAAVNTPTVVVKSSDQSDTSGALINDSELLLPVGANEKWDILLVIRSSYVTNQGRAALALPASGTDALMIAFSAAAEVDGTTEVMLSSGAGAVIGFNLQRHLYIGGGNAGNWQFRFRSFNAMGECIIRTNSYLIATQLA